MHPPIIRCASLSLTQPLNSPANASSALQLYSPIIYRALLSLTQPLNSPANASSALQLHFPIELRTPKNPRKAMPQSRRGPAPQPCRNRAAHAPHMRRTKRSDTSYRQPTSLLNSPANASSALQLHSAIIYRTLLSLTQPLNSPANASSALQLHFPIELRTPKNRRKPMPQSRRGPAPKPRRNRAAPAPHQAFRHELPSAYFSSRHAPARTHFATFRNSEVSLLNFL